MRKLLEPPFTAYFIERGSPDPVIVFECEMWSPPGKDDRFRFKGKMYDVRGHFFDAETNGLFIEVSTADNTSKAPPVPVRTASL